MPNTKRQRSDATPSEGMMMARQCAEFMLTRKAKDVVVMDIHELTDMADFFVIGSADSDTQLKAIADAVLDGMNDLDSKPYRTEGWNGGQWIILDFVEVVVHVFHREARDFYKIERLWSDAVVERVVDEAAAEA